MSSGLNSSREAKKISGKDPSTRIRNVIVYKDVAKGYKSESVPNSKVTLKVQNGFKDKAMKAEHK